VSQENVEIVQRMYEAFHGGDFEAALAHFDDEVVIDTTHGRVDGGVAQGRDSVAPMIAQWIAAFEDWREEIDEIRALGDKVYVAATQRGRGKETGIDVETPYGIVYEVRDGRIARLTMYIERKDALRAAGAG
jgi:ketosteroid isomerase-like protein